MALAGSSKVIAREYGNWFRSNFKTPIQPRWYQETNDFQTVGAPDWGAHVGNSKFLTSTEYRQTFFDQLKKHLYLSRELTVQELYGWRNWGPDRCVEPCNNRADLGGNRKMRKGIAQVHQIGRHINSYFGASTGLFDLVKPNKPRSFFELVRKDQDEKKFKASIEIPGFEMVVPSTGPSSGPREVTLPAIVEFKKTADVKEAGQYYFIIRGDETLPYRGWFNSK